MGDIFTSSLTLSQELEKVHDKAYLQALLVPWETGRVQGITGHPSRSVDISKIVWICTSNVASQDIVKHSRENPRTQEWFEKLRLIARIQLGDELGVSRIHNSFSSGT
jgi:ATP-dependent Clp protease ATP-binding subunit ClpA